MTQQHPVPGRARGRGTASARGGGTSGRGAPPIRTTLLRITLVFILAYTGLGAGLTYWQVVRAQDLTIDPANPLVQAAEQGAIPGRILDSRGTVLVDTVSDAKGNPLRRYHDASLGPVIGYRSSRFGTAGLERAYDAQLVGLAGQSLVDQFLRKFRAGGASPSDLVLGIDDRLQQKAADLLGDRKGAIVALDPTTGRILAMVSAPGYDANDIVNPTTGTKAFRALQQDAATPLLDRVTQGRYVPGSVFKIVTAIAGLGSGAISAKTTFPDQPAEEKTGFLVQGYRVRDGHHAETGSTPVDFPTAVEVSCNIYFAHVGLKVGGPGLVDWAGRLGFGAAIPFDLPTVPSQVTNGSGPDGGFRDEVELANASYGQAETFVTPLQMALVAAAVANHGVLMVPQLVTATVDASGTHQRSPETWRTVIDAPDAATIAAAMQQAVEGQLGREFAGAAKVPGVPTAGKTGTAQLGGTGEPHSWFIGFAPANAPKIAIAVIIERGGAGATQAAPLAGDLMQAALALGE
jgi:penicillin-binding protein A